MQITRKTAPWRAALGLGLAALAGAAALPAGAQGLSGQAVQQTYRYPSKTTVYENDGTQLVSPTGTNYTDSGASFTTVLKPTQVTFTFGSSIPFGSAAFNGVALSETGPLPATITGVFVASSTLPGFDATRVSFDSTDIFANFAGLGGTPGQTVTLNFTADPPVIGASTPEPSSVAAFGFTALGIGGLTLRARKRRAA